MWYIHTVEYYYIMKRRSPIHAATWAVLENITKNERKLLPNITHYLILCS
jgi:hypothetical protein